MYPKDRVIELLKSMSGLENIGENDRLQVDIALDSLEMVLLLVELEDTLGVELDESDMTPFDLSTVADLVRLAERYCGGSNE